MVVCGSASNGHDLAAVLDHVAYHGSIASWTSMVVFMLSYSYHWSCSIVSVSTIIFIVYDSGAPVWHQVWSSVHDRVHSNRAFHGRRSFDRASRSSHSCV